ncbi:glycosyltransferase [Pseudoroseomonas sp. WGS1072]|uniref:glycosyltransferase n=1 Tax=Roseomonas sp. WGS1072 TaxID=3366816 RepID=UPI003BF0D591
MPEPVPPTPDAALPPARRLRRALMLLPSRGFGGTERHSLALMAALMEAGCAVACAAAPELHPALLAAWPGREPPDLRPADLAWHPGRTAESHAAQHHATRALLADGTPDVAILPLPWPEAGLGCLRALAETGQPSLAIGHLAPRQRAFLPLDDAGQRDAARLVGGWVAVSAPVRAGLAWRFALPEATIALVPNGARPPAGGDRAGRRARVRQDLGLAPGTRLALFLGRLDPAKGADLLPDIARRLAAGPPAVLAVAGAGAPPTLEAALRRAARGDNPPLRLLGFRQDAGALLEAADALLLPSRLEGYPLAFLEAALRRCPVVASEAALEGLGEEAAEVACLAPTGDAAALATALATVLRGGAEVARRQAAAEALALRQDEAAMCARYLGLLRGVLLGSTGAAR